MLKHRPRPKRSNPCSSACFLALSTTPPLLCPVSSPHLVFLLPFSPTKPYTHAFRSPRRRRGRRSRDVRRQDLGAEALCNGPPRVGRRLALAVWWRKKVRPRARPVQNRCPLRHSRACWRYVVATSGQDRWPESVGCGNVVYGLRIEWFVLLVLLRLSCKSWKAYYLRPSPVVLFVYGIQSVVSVFAMLVVDCLNRQIYRCLWCCCCFYKCDLVIASNYIAFFLNSCRTNGQTSKVCGCTFLFQFFIVYGFAHFPLIQMEIHWVCLRWNHVSYSCCCSSPTHWCAFVF
jgi:hypothetical protein